MEEMLLQVLVNRPLPTRMRGAFVVPPFVFDPDIRIDVSVSDPLPLIINSEHPLPSLRASVMLKVEKVASPELRVNASLDEEKVFVRVYITVVPIVAGVISTVYASRSITDVSLE